MTSEKKNYNNYYHNYYDTNLSEASRYRREFLGQVFLEYQTQSESVTVVYDKRELI